MGITDIASSAGPVYTESKTGTCSCQGGPPSLEARQEDVVRALQDRLAAIAKTAPAGHLKDVSSALAAAVDKLVLLKRKDRAPHWGGTYVQS